MSDLLAGGGLLIAAAASAVAILLPPGRLRSAAMLAAVILFPVLIVGDQWHSVPIVDLRHHLARFVALGAGALAISVALAFSFRRWSLALPLAIVAALPFRIPLHAGGETANLLVPLYLVIAGGVFATALRDWAVGKEPSRAGGTAAGGPHSAGRLRRPSTWGRAAVTGPARLLPLLLAAVVVLYALQTLYSADFSKGLQNACFFLIPFTVAFGLLEDVEWDARLLRWALVVVGVEASAFVFVGSIEYLTRDLFWNDQIIRSNEFHTYFRVNSVFWDPNIYGRYLALVTVVATAALLWTRTRDAFWLLTGLILVLWLGLVPTFSQSSLLALLAGLAMLAAIRWSWRWTLAAAALGVIGAVLVVVLVGGPGKVSLSRVGKVDLSGRGNLISGGAGLFADRPLWGYGSGSFQSAYREHRENKDVAVTVSHTEPVTVAAEQGLIGLVAYLALIVTALWAMGSGLWRGPPVGARAAVLAAFVALLVHTLAYAGFFEDPIAWLLLALGASLAATPAARSAIRDPA